MSETLRFPPLSADNYASWKIDMKSALLLKDLWPAVVENDVYNALDTDRQDIMTEKAKALMLVCTSADLKSLISDEQSACMAWKALKSTFEERSAGRKFATYDALHDLTKLATEDVLSFFARGERLWKELRETCSEQLSEDFLIHCVAKGLGKGYENLIQHVRYSESLTLTTFKSKLLRAEADCKKKATESEVYQVRTLGKREPRLCWKCNKPGHWKRDCPHKKGDAIMFGVVFVSGEAKQPNFERAAVLDTGATDHVFNDATYFVELNNIEDRYVVVGGGEKHQVRGVGKVVVEGPQGSVHLTDVLHVPTMCMNLISVSQITTAGAQVYLSGAKCVVKHQGKTVLVGKKQHKLFLVQIPVKNQTWGLGVCSMSTWHRRLGHLGYDGLQRLVQEKLVQGVPRLVDDRTSKVCEACMKGRQSRQKFVPSESVAVQLLGIIHADIMGPFEVASRGGARFALTVIDDYSKYSEVCCLAGKAGVFEHLKEIMVRWERQTGYSVKVLRTDNGLEFCNQDVDGFLRGRGIEHQRSVRYTPQQNGRAERVQRTLMEKARSMMAEAQVPKDFWGEALMTSNTIRNLSPVKNRDKTPFEMFQKRKPDLSMLRVFGCRAFVLKPKEKRRKLDERSYKGIFVGYAVGSKAWRILVHDGGQLKLHISRDVEFDEGVMGFDDTSVRLDDDAADLSLDIPGLAEEDGEDQREHLDLPQAAEGEEDMDEGGAQSEGEMAIPVAEGITSPDVTSIPAATPAPSRYPSRIRNAPSTWYDTFVGASTSTALSDEPATLTEVKTRPDYAQWVQAMDVELASLLSNGTYSLVELPFGRSPVPSKWVFKVKRDAHGNIDKYKARLVAKGFRQVAGKDFDEVYAPVSRYATLRMFLAMVAMHDLELHQLDVKTAFLNGDLQEELYMAPPPGYEHSCDGKVWRLHKAIYGLKQAARAWHLKLKAALVKAGFAVSQADPSLFVLTHGGALTYLLVYVDDALIAGNHDQVNIVKDIFRSQFDVHELGEAVYFLGFQIARDRKNKELWVGQTKFARETLERFGMKDCKSKLLPFDVNVKLSKFGEDVLDVSVYPYMELVGTLLYLVGCTRPDLAYVVGVLSRFMSQPRVEHWQVAQQVLRYLAGTVELGILFRGTEQQVVGYCDADYAGDPDKRRSTSGYLFMMAGGVVSWGSKLQPTVAASTCEAEYISSAFAVKEALWVRKVLQELLPGGYQKPMLIFGDNQGALALLKHPNAHQRTKHIDVAFHFARDRIERGEVAFDYCQTDRMVADCLTKAVPFPKFEANKKAMGLEIKMY
jgi:transposase InsO family protein